MRDSYLKRYKLMSLLLVVVVVILVPILLRKPSECTDYLANRMILDPLTMPDLKQVRLLEAETIPNMTRLARLNTNWIRRGDFTLTFSPDNFLLAISGIGAAYNSSGTFLWKLRRSPLCILEVGSVVPSEYYRNLFEAFSSDSQLVLLDRCESNPLNNCFSLWDTHYNNFVNRFYDAKFIQKGDEIRLEYREGENTPLKMSEQSWQVINLELSPIETVISETTVQLTDRNSGDALRTITVEGNVNDAKISPDGKLLALAITQPNKYTPYYTDTFVELWGVVDTSGEEK